MAPFIGAEAFFADPPFIDLLEVFMAGGAFAGFSTFIGRPFIAFLLLEAFIAFPTFAVFAIV